MRSDHPHGVPHAAAQRRQRDRHATALRLARSRRAARPRGERERADDHRQRRAAPAPASAAGCASRAAAPATSGCRSRTTAATLTALVSTKISTERFAIRSTEMPLLRSTHAPSAMPARPLTDTDRVDRQLRQRQSRGQAAPEVREDEPEQDHVADAREQLEQHAREHPAGARVLDLLAPPRAGRARRAAATDDEHKEDREADDAVAQGARLRRERVLALLDRPAALPRCVCPLGNSSDSPSLPVRPTSVAPVTLA